MAEYKIKDVEVLTGIKAHTIRIWEKRYGILVPERTKSKIRSYCDEDLTQLLNISILNQNGLKISKIAELSRDQIKERVKKLSFSESGESAVLSLLINALIEFDDVLFKRVLGSVIHKEGVESCYFNYILPFLDKVGIMWIVGTILPTQEHFISNLIREMLIVETNKLPVSTSGKTFVLFCREGDWHELSLLLYNFLLKERGDNTLYLGQSLPLDGLKRITEKVKVEAFVSSLIAPLNAQAEEEFNRFTEEIDIPVYIGGSHSKRLLNKKSDLARINDVKQLFM